MAIFQFFSMAVAAILVFKISNCLSVGTFKRVKLHHCAKFRRNRSNRNRYIVIFRFFKDGGRRHLGFSKIQIINGRGGLEGRTASSCQISSKSVQPRLKYGDFSIFQDGGRRHLGFSTFQIFNGGDGQGGRTTSPRQISLKSAKMRPRYCDLSRVSSH